MQAVILTALGVGGATVLGAVIGFIFREWSVRHGGAVLGFGAGVMLAATVLGLVLPALEYGGKYGVFITVMGVFAGALSLFVLDRLLPALHGASDGFSAPRGNTRCERVLLFVLAIALHNLPEGIAAGVGFGTGNVGEALFIAGGIALQNIPEGMVIIAPMLAAGFSPTKTFVLAFLTGVIEVIGTLIGYFAVGVAAVVLPISLSFAAGCMLYVISDEIIPEMGAGGEKTAPVFALIAGLCLMVCFDAWL